RLAGRGLAGRFHSRVFASRRGGFLPTVEVRPTWRGRGSRCAGRRAGPATPINVGHRLDHGGMHMIETIWFAIWGIAWAVYFMLDGFDLGIGMLLPFLGKSESDKRVLINAMGPFWDGNEVWLITAGGVTFAAFPRTYAVMFSG